MNPEDRGPASEPDLDPGPPIHVLREQEQETSSDFMGRVRRRIYRRTATSQLASYSWNLPKVVLLEMAGLLTHLLKTFGNKKDPKV